MEIEDRLRLDLAQIRAAALRAVDPKAAVHQFVESDSNEIRFGSTTWRLSEIEHVFLVGIGKASIKMAQAAVEILGSRLSAGVIVTKYGNRSEVELPGCLSVIEAGHPVPDQQGYIGARAIAGLLEGTTPRDRVLVLLSGGASALAPFPVPPITLEDLQEVTTLLLRSGAAIYDLNTVRKHLDYLKGGRLAKIAYPAPLVSLILSDVVGDPLDVIASGPTVPDPTTYSDASNTFERFGLIDQVPRAVLDHLRLGLNGELLDTPKPGDGLFEQVTNIVIGSNQLAATAAVSEASRLGYHSLLLSTYLEGEAREVGKVVASLGKSICLAGCPMSPPACIVLGGETTVTVTGRGKGGRNQELALSASIGLDGLDNVAVMALATDGTDGPTDAAGAIVGGGTARKMRSRGIDFQEAFRDNDSYRVLREIDELMVIGPTGTNVNDLTVVLVR